MTADDQPTALVDALARTAPDEFVVRRNALAKQLGAAEQRDAATAVAAMRKPTWIDWALCELAHASPQEVGAFVELAVAVRDAQSAAIEGREGGDLRSAMRRMREAASSLARSASLLLVGAGRPADDLGIVRRLTELATSTTSLERLRAGRLTVDADGASDVFDGLVPAARPARSAARSAARPHGGTGTRRGRDQPAPAAQDAPADDGADGERGEAPGPPPSDRSTSSTDDGRADVTRRRELDSRLRRLVKEHTTATAWLARADDQLRRVRERTERSARSVAKAEAKVAAARAALARADETLTAAHDEHDALASDLDRASADQVSASGLVAGRAAALAAVEAELKALDSGD